ncbi:unnamed protein product [Rotaria sp. Silwood1]|nr:unnamed protein product [Rotaria sp. Silwood1]
MMKEIQIPKLYVETILDIHTKFLKFVKEAFNNEQDFTVALDKACAKFINNNTVTIAAGNTTKSPELLVQYCNTLLRKGLEKHLQNFIIFYNQQHNGRKLMLLHQYSKEDLQTLYTKQKYILHVSTYEMIILLLFNEHSSWTVERMQDETQIDIHLFLQILCNNLLKSKLITCSDINDNKLEEDLNENNIKMNYNIQIANDFKRSVCT